jgi:hypothetical protein
MGSIAASYAGFRSRLRQAREANNARANAPPTSIWDVGSGETDNVAGLPTRARWSAEYVPGVEKEPVGKKKTNSPLSMVEKVMVSENPAGLLLWFENVTAPNGADSEVWQLAVVTSCEQA